MKTGEDGYTQTLQRLPEGEYEIYETYLGKHNDLYDLGTFTKDGGTYHGNLLKTITLTSKKVREDDAYINPYTVSIVNEYVYGQLIVQKKDYRDNSTLNLSGFGFKIYYEDEDKWIGKDDHGDQAYTAYENATEFFTKEEVVAGNKEYRVPIISRLKPGQYRVYETTIPEAMQDYFNWSVEKQDLPDGKGGTVQVKVGKSTNNGVKIFEGANVVLGHYTHVTFINKRDVVKEFYIQKKGLQDAPLNGVSFKIYSEDKKGWVVTLGDDLKYVGCTSTFAGGKTLTTGADGNTPKIKRLPAGKYTIFETSIGSNSEYKPIGNTSVNGTVVKANRLNTIELQASDSTYKHVEINLPENGKLEITKKDSGTYPVLNLSDIGFKIFYNNGPNNDTSKKNKWVKREDDGSITYTTFDDATEFKTQKVKVDGNDEYKVPEIEKLTLGSYSIYETSIPESLKNYFNGVFNQIPIPGQTEKEASMKLVGTATVNKSSVAKVVVENKRDVVKEFYIYKKGYEGTKEVPLNGISFKIYKEGNGWILTNNYTFVGYSDTFREGTLLTTGTDGNTQRIKRLPAGIYTIYETSRGSNPDYNPIGKTTVNGKEIVAEKLSTITLEASISAYKHEETNTPEYGRLEILKNDERADSQLNLSDIGFKIFYNNGSNNDASKKNKWIKRESNGNITYTTFEQATEFKTEAVTGNGKTRYKVPEIQKLAPGSYSIYETSIPENLKDYFNGVFDEIPIPGQTEKNARMKLVGTKKVVKGTLVTVTVRNTRDVVKEFYIHKTGNQNYPLNGIKFKIYSEDKKGWVTTTGTGNNFTFVGYTDVFIGGTTLTSKADGKTETIKRLPAGRYTIYETGIGSNIDYKPIGTTTVNNKKVDANKLSTITLEASTDTYIHEEQNIPVYGQLEIVKIDEKSNSTLNLSNIGFKVYNSDKKKWVNSVAGNITYTTFDEATEFKTEQTTVAGKVSYRVPTIYKLDPGNYIVYETSIPDENNLRDYFNWDFPEIPLPDNPKITKKIKQIGAPTVVAGSKTTVTARNPRDICKEFYILKKDALTGNSLNNIKFKLYKPGSGWVVTDSNNVWGEFSSTYKAGKTLTTGTNGKTEVIKRLPIGDYVIYEIGLGSYYDYPSLKSIKVGGESIVAREAGTVNLTPTTSTQQYKDVTNTPILGKISLKKTDEFNTQLNFSNIGYKIYDKKRGKWVTDISTDTSFGAYKYAKEFFTDNKGNLTINNLRVGDYVIYETSIPTLLQDYYELTEITLEDGKKAKEIDTVSITESNQNITIDEAKAKNTRDYISLNIHKRDKLTKADMKGVTFKLYKKDSGWVTWNNDMIVTSTTAKYAKATGLTTKENGYTDYIKRLPIGEYYIYETNLGSFTGQYEVQKYTEYGANITGNKVTKTFTAQPNLNQSILIENMPILGKISLKKTDEFNAELNFSNVGYKLYSKTKKQWVISTDGDTRWGTYAQAKEFYTADNKGNLTIENLRVGDYVLYETTIPTQLQDYYYLTQITLADGRTANAKEIDTISIISKNTIQVSEAKAKNKRYYTNLYIDKNDILTKAAMDNVYFKLYKKDTGWVKWDSDNIVTSTTAKYNDANVLISGESGTKGRTKTIKRLPIGEYVIFEINMGEYTQSYETYNLVLPGTQQTIDGNRIDKTISAKKTLTQGILYENKPVQGSISLQKTDQFDVGGPTDFTGVEYMIYSKTKQQWVTSVDGDTRWGNYDDAKPFTTDKNGNLKIENLRVGEYIVYETKIPNQLLDYYYLKQITLADGTKANAKEIDTINITKTNRNITIEKAKSKNMRYYSNFYLEKIDQLTKAKVDGISFILYKLPDENDNGGWVKWDSNNIVTSATESKKANASILVSGEGGTKGRTKTIRRLPLGKYEIYEIDLGEHDDVYEIVQMTVHGETFDAKKFDYTHTAKPSIVTSTLLENPRVFVTVTGNVWEDVGIGKDTLIYNDKLDTSDIRVNNVKVKLIDMTTKEIVQSTSTKYLPDKSAYGRYKFGKVRIANLSKYYIEFTYDGITYSNVTIGDLNSANASKANETNANIYANNKDLRKILNDTFTNLTGEGQTLSYNGKSIKLTYSKEKRNGATVVMSNNICDRNSASNNILANSSSPYVILSSPNSTTKNFEGDFPMWSATSKTFLNDQWEKQIKPKGGKEIENVNLGLKLREQPDLSLVKETQSATLSINGYSNVYNYKASANAIPTETGVIFQREAFGEISYRLPIYRADAVYTNASEKSRELNVSITYKIAFVNNSTSLYARINDLHEIYSTDMIFEKMYSLNANGQEHLISGIVGEKAYSKDSNYKEYTFKDINIKVAPRNSSIIYVQFKLPRENILKNATTVDNGKALRNYVEIGSYTVYSDNSNTLYAGFDVDSIPNNINIKNYATTHEDDEDRAPTLKITDVGDRKASGIVFEDSASVGKGGENNERKGDGKYTTGENTISNVKVELINLDGAGVKTDSDVTDIKGKFEISGFIPGRYKLQYTWGEGMGTTLNDGTKVTVDGYKSTIWTAQNKADKDNNSNWYEIRTGTRYSDALDDYSLREKLDKQTKSLYDLVKNEPIYNENNTIDRATMISNTKDIVYEIELTEEEELDENYVPPVYNLTNVDFGLIERPRQKMEITKNVKSLTVKTDNNQNIINVKVKDDGTLDILSGSVTGGPIYGFIKAETDSDLMDSGTTATVEYEIKVRNTSEIDYAGSNYYWYGNSNGCTKVTLKAVGIYDYVKGLKPKIEDNSDWELIKNDTKYDTVTQTMSSRIVNNSSTSAKSSWYEILSNGTKKLIEETVGESTREIIEEYYQESTLGAKTFFKEFIKDDRIISLLKESKNGIEIVPGDSKSYSFNASIPLSSLEEITFDNDVEIADITRTQDVGRMTKLEESKLYERAERITVTPPTGENRDYTIIILITASALTVFGIGLIIIKKYVLKKN